MTVTRGVPVAVLSRDPVLRDGVIAQFRGRWEIDAGARTHDARVSVIVADELDRETLDACRRFRRSRADAGVVVVVSRLDDMGLLTGFEAGASGFVRRNEAVPERLVPVVVAVDRGEVSVPPDLIGGLLTHLSRLQTVGSTGPVPTTSLSMRETEVLRLASEGLETSEIARRLSYSERTVKGVVHDITTRLQLRNRTHAVAYAVKNGLI
jgi:DNA-binding NarL/FixJ family response regulator